MINDLFLKFEQEQYYRNSNYEIKASRAENLWQLLKQGLGKKVSLELDSVRNDVERIQFSHLGLDKSDYFLHVLRVASLAGILNNDFPVSSVKVGFLHNIYEVTSMETLKTVNQYGSQIEKIIVSLKIERDFQNDQKYLSKYYKNIRNLPENLGIIKILDKLDNLYTLNFAASPLVKVRYLDEVRNYVVPLCNDVAPQLLEVLNDTIDKVQVK